ncbi:MAG: hypothetical protein M4579_005804 [Chaenotheca gracillima]|nr:MAG: hypothetical protein M4579_005804 [Chaenotheca gracillima]
MIDPVQAFNLDPLKKTTSIFATTTSSSIAPPPTVIPDHTHIAQITEVGQRTLWIVFVLMLLSTIVFAGLAYRTPVQKRLFHIITVFITTFATISYFAMATGDGISVVSHTVTHSHKYGIPDTYSTVGRQVFWARYVDWSLTTPLLLLDLAFLAGMNGSNMIVAIVADVIMILTGLFAGYGGSDGQKWGWYAIACIAYLVVVWQLAVSGRSTAIARDSKTGAFFTALGLFTLVLWTVYPVIWGIADGGQKISVDAEVIAYAILDVLAKPVFGFWLLITHDRIASTNVPLEGAWSHGFGKGEGTLRVGDDDEGA